MTFKPFTAEDVKQVKRENPNLPLIECKRIALEEYRKKVIEAMREENQALTEKVEELEDKIDSLEEYNEFLEDWIDRQSDRINKLLISYKRLRMFAATVWGLLTRNEPRFVWADMEERAKELGIEKMEIV